MKFVFWATELQVSMSFSHLMYHWLESALYLKFTIYRKFSMYHSLCQMLTFPQICLCFFSVAFMWMIFISFPEFIVLFYGCMHQSDRHFLGHTRNTKITNYTKVQLYFIIFHSDWL
jgi:hypothetical protein